MQNRFALYAVLSLIVVCTVIQIIGFGVFGKQTNDTQKMTDTDFAKGCKENRCSKSDYEARYYTIDRNSPTRITYVLNSGLGGWSIKTQGKLGNAVLYYPGEDSTDIIYTPNKDACGIDCIEVQCKAQGAPWGIAVLPIQIQIRAPQ